MESWVRLEPASRDVAKRLSRITLHPLALLLFTYICNTLLWALIIEPGRAPDEWDHFNYIRHLVYYRSLPIYGQTPRLMTPSSLNSETQQPPLYYLLATPIQFLVAEQPLIRQVLALRLFSIVLGTTTVALTYALGRVLVPGRRVFAFSLATIVAFNPMFTFMSAAISNDALINLIVPALLLLLTLMVQRGSVNWVWLVGLGALLGAGLLAKFAIASGVVASGIVLFWLVWRQPGRRFARLLISSAWVGSGLLVVASWYILRNWWLYGDPTGVLVMS